MESALLLSEPLSKDCVRVPLGSHAKVDLLRELVHPALGESDKEIVDGAIAAVEARENQLSTATQA